MRKIDHSDIGEIRQSQKTEFTKEELLDILDFYLQYKPLFDETLDINLNYSPLQASHDFTLLLYKYGIMDFNYFVNLDKICEKYGKKTFMTYQKKN